MSGSRGGARRSGLVAAAFWVLVLSEAGSAAVAVAMVVRPSVLPSAWSHAGGDDALVRAWGVTWLALSVLLLGVLAAGFRRGVRGSRLAAALVPVVWLSHALLAPGPWWNVALAVITAVAAGIGLASLVTGRGEARGAG